MLVEEVNPNIDLDPLGHFQITENELPGPHKIEGMIYKLGHVMKNWRKRKVVIEDGILKYYRIGIANSEVLKGSLSLQNYMVKKVRRHELYLWSTQIGQNHKDLQLHISVSPENPYTSKLWIAAIRCHIRYAHETYLTKFDWYPLYEYFIQRYGNQQQLQQLQLQPPPSNPSRMMSDEESGDHYHFPSVLKKPFHYFEKRVYQVVRRDGASVFDGIEEEATFVSFLRHHEIIEINQIVLNLQNNCRGRLSNGDGWVTLSNCDGSLILLELRTAEETEDPDQTFSDLKRNPVAVSSFFVSNSARSSLSSKVSVSRTNTLVSDVSDVGSVNGPNYPVHSYSKYHFSYYSINKKTATYFQRDDFHA